METNKKLQAGYPSLQLLTSSEVELMETVEKFYPTTFAVGASDFLGSWINGNNSSSGLIFSSKLATSDFLGSWINGNCYLPNQMWQKQWQLLTSSEVELMETFEREIPLRYESVLLTSSEVELMETQKPYHKPETRK